MSSLPDRDRAAAPSRGGVGALSWRILVDEPLSGPANMARDHALATLARPGTGTLRLYRWHPATISFGRNEPVNAAYRELLRRRPEMGVVRRPTGGRAVIHDRELTYSVVVPARACGGLRPAYRKINEGLLEGLRRLGVAAVPATGHALPPGSGPCFLEAAGGEVTVGGRKLVGSAQMRIGGTILQHGSLLLVADQEALFGGAPHGGPGPAGRPRGRVGGGGRGAAGRRGPVTLAEVLGELPPWNRIAEVLAGGLRQAFGGRWSRGSLNGGEKALAAKLEKRYGSHEWTWRR